MRPTTFRIDPFHPLARGLVFAGLGNCGDSRSSKCEDSSPYRNHGTLTNMAIPATETSGWQYVPELGRWAVQGDGINDSVVISPNSRFNGTTGTCAGWVKWKSAIGAKRILTYHDGAGDQIGITPYDSYPHFHIFDSTVTIKNVRSNIPGGPLTGTWMHFACTWNNGVLDLFINGVSNNTAPTGAGTGIFDFNLPGVNTILCEGEIAGSDICIWSRPLSPAEIRQLADPSNVMLSGLIRSASKRSYFYMPAAPTGTSMPIYTYLHRRRWSA